MERLERTHREWKGNTLEDELIKMIRKVLGITTGTQTKVQSFDKEWDAWINVKPGSALQDSTRLKCVTIVSVMPSASAENRP